jgi:ubiquinol-cytochrome c reductase cytochrome b subunit
MSPEERADLDKVILAVSAEAGLSYQAEADEADRALIDEGRELIASEEINCVRCHAFGGVLESDEAPVLIGWGSRDWLLGLMHDPTQVQYYGADNDGMPSFGVEGSLTRAQMELLADWLRRDWYVHPENE